jgi:DNA-binding CsgD family transcriptional regulator
MEDDRLTPREREVLALANAGRTNEQIAEALGITRNAVRYHLKEIHSKLGTGGDRAQLRRVHGLVPTGVPGAGLLARLPRAAFAVTGGLALLAAAGLGIGLALRPEDGVPVQVQHNPDAITSASETLLPMQTGRGDDCVAVVRRVLDQETSEYGRLTNLLHEIQGLPGDTITVAIIDSSGEIECADHD